MLRIGLIGCGHHGWNVLVPTIAEGAKHCELAAVADVSRDNLELMKKYPDVATYLDYREMIKSERLDVAYVCTPVAHHYEPTIAALEAGLHVVCEKPLADSVEHCERMIDAADRADRRLAVTFENRYQPYVRTVRRWIAEGHLGTVEAVHAQHFWDGHKTFGDMAERRARFIDASGGLDCGIHTVDLVRHFAGGGDWKDMHAIGAWLGEPRKKASHLAILASLTSGALASISVSMGYTAQIKARATSHTLTIVGDKGVVDSGVGEDGKHVVTLTSDTLTESVSMAGHGHRHTIEWMLDDFADLVEGRKDSSDDLANGADGLAAVILTEEVNRQAVEKHQA